MIDEYFMFLHRDMPRQGPGSSRSTRIAANFLPEQSYQSILDIGCGPGMQTMDLASVYPRSEITALDYYTAFLEQLDRSCRERGLSNISTMKGSMMKLPFKKGVFDLIWSEGAVYIMGFEEGLKQWRPFLKEGGCLAVTELSWLSPYRPDIIEEYWEDNYPDMSDIPANLEMIEQTGYRLCGLYVLPVADWYTHYYNPLLRNLKKEQGRPLTKEQMNCLALEFLEIDMHSQYSDYYSYVFYVMQKS